MKRAARPGEASDSDDSDDEDAAERRALAESRAGGGARAQLASARATAASDRAGLERAAKTILPGGAPWLETLVLTAPSRSPLATDDDLGARSPSGHMAKVKENLLFQQKKMDAFEQRKRRQAEVKYAKALQAEKVAEKSAKKKAELREAGGKKRKGGGAKGGGAKKPRK
ncbi:rRNA-processing protein [Aureococcus anophagefferens]|uniref:rRNA-processing protein n=1 Tax=Aureococcus anophagefferens TaxID=44056 RepID=A0ABR1FX85_AURAN